MNEQLPECHVNALNAEATALIGVAEFLLSQPQLSEWDVCCHFDALSVGQGTFGWSNCCTVERENGVRQTAARILMSMVQRRIGKIQGHHTHAHVGQLWNEMADSIAGAICDGWTAPTPAELKSHMLLSHSMKEWAWMQIKPGDELPCLEDVLQNRPPNTATGQIDSTLQVHPD